VQVGALGMRACISAVMCVCADIVLVRTGCDSAALHVTVVLAETVTQLIDLVRAWMDGCGNGGEWLC